MLNFVRHKVSLNKIRYIKDGFDLDLTYITDSIVAMGFPAVGMEAMYRNPRPQVQKLLEKLHRDKYKVYNLCAEPKWSYSPEVFHERVGRYPFHDHQAPPLALMGQFCKDVEEWLAKDKEHIAAVHCKAGKGRAGMMICCWLVHSKTYPTAEEAMKQYGMRRTRDGKGVTIPSQRRYVTYYEDIVNFGYPESPKIKVKSVFVQTSHYSKPEPGEPWVEILSEGKERLFASKPERVRGGDLVVEVGGVEVKGDIKINVYDGSRAKKGKPICHFWFNTAWIDGNKLTLTRPQIDKAWNDKKFKVFQKDFEIVVEFEGAAVSTISQMRKQGPISSKSDKPSKSSKKEKKESRKHKKDEKKVEEGAKQLVLEEEKPKKEEVKTNGDEKAEKVQEEKPEVKAEVKDKKAEVSPEAKVQPQEPKDDADTVVFISSKPLESPKEERKDSSSDSSSSEEETRSEDNKGEEAKAVLVLDSTDDSSSSTDSSEESSEVQQPPVVSEVKQEQPASQPVERQEESSDDSSSTNSSEESSEGPAEKAAPKHSSGGEERDIPVPSANKQERPASSDSSDSSEEKGEKGSSSESDSDL